MRIHFREPCPSIDPPPSNPNSTLDLIRATSELKINQVHELVKAQLDQGHAHNLVPNQSHYVPCIHRHHLAFQGLRFIRQNSLVLDGWQVRDGHYYYQHQHDHSSNRLHFYRLCDDHKRGLGREPLPESLDHIVYMDFKLTKMTGREQLNILDMWLHSNSPVKLLHLDVCEIDQVGCFDLLGHIENIKWNTNLFLDIWDRTPHWQNLHSVQAIARRLSRLIKYSITAEYHSAPISNISGLSYLYDLKDLDSAPIRYYELNKGYLSFMDALSNDQVRGEMIS